MFDHFPNNASSNTAFFMLFFLVFLTWFQRWIIKHRASTRFDYFGYFKLIFNRKAWKLRMYTSCKISCFQCSFSYHLLSTTNNFSVYISLNSEFTAPFFSFSMHLHYASTSSVFLLRWPSAQFIFFFHF